jgi:hypothetical protein
MTERCPRCGHTEVTVRKFTVPSGSGNATVYDYYCPKCGLLETINADEPGWEEKLERWQQQPVGAPEALEAYWYPDSSGYHTTVNTTAGKQRWRLTVETAEPRYTLAVEGQPPRRLRTDQWPTVWRLANGAASPHEPNQG